MTKKKYLQKTLLKTNNIDNLVLEKTDLDFSNDIVSKKKYRNLQNSTTIDLTTRNEEIGIYADLDKNEYFIIKTKNGQFIFTEMVELEEKYSIIEHIMVNKNNISQLKPILVGANYNFENKSGFFIKDDIFK